MTQYFIDSATILKNKDVQLNITPYISTTHALSQRLKWASFHHEWSRNSGTVCEGTPNSIIYWALSASGRDTGGDAAHDTEDWQPAANKYNSQADRID